MYLLQCIRESRSGNTRSEMGKWIQELVFDLQLHLTDDIIVKSRIIYVR